MTRSLKKPEQVAEPAAPGSEHHGQRQQGKQTKQGIELQGGRASSEAWTPEVKSAPAGSSDKKLGDIMDDDPGTVSTRSRTVKPDRHSCEKLTIICPPVRPVSAQDVARTPSSQNSFSSNKPSEDPRKIPFVQEVPSRAWPFFNLST